MNIPEFTVLCAVDDSHVDELAISYDSWRRHKPSLLSRPMLVMIDVHSTPSEHSWHTNAKRYWASRLDFLGSHSGKVEFRFSSAAPDIPVRERVLSSFVFAAKFIETPYYLKLDADLLATGCDDWIDPKWFWGGPEVIAPRWGYTKPASQVAAFNAWSNGFPDAFPLAGVQAKIVGNYAKHHRFISYCQFGSTFWTQGMSKLAGERLPIPSQDGFLSMCAYRGGARVKHFDAKALGWRHIGGGIEKLRRAAEVA